MQEKIRKKKQQMAKLDGKIQRLKVRAKQESESKRKARTRTLIQLGGLVELAGLSQLFGITLGQDLQLHKAEMDKAATLLGALLEFEASTAMTQDLRNQWFEEGIQCLKRNAATI